MVACFVSSGAKVTNRLRDRASHPAFVEGNEGEMNRFRWGLYISLLRREMKLTLCQRRSVLFKSEGGIPKSGRQSALKLRMLVKYSCFQGQDGHLAPESSTSSVFRLIWSLYFLQNVEVVLFLA